VTELRYERERRGWSLDDVASRTRIPRQYLEALEDGNHEVLPPGPFFRGYLRQYLEFLGEEVSEDERTEAQQDVVDEVIEGQVARATSAAMESSQGVPLTRLVIAGFVLTLAMTLALQVNHRLNAPTIVPTAHGPIVAMGPPHKVNVYAIEDVEVEVTIDGHTSYNDTLRGTNGMEFQATNRLELDISDLTRVRLQYNNKRIEPLGSLSRGRRLVFIHETRN
jgi:transcriptional regulator with XRE-family HTH domain